MKLKKVIKHDITQQNYKDIKVLKKNCKTDQN